MPADVLGIIEERQKRFQDYLTAKGVCQGSKPGGIENCVRTRQKGFSHL
jgi:hypothetical protein